jgi:hypothetical protein
VLSKTARFAGFKINHFNFSIKTIICMQKYSLNFLKAIYVGFIFIFGGVAGAKAIQAEAPKREEAKPKSKEELLAEAVATGCKVCVTFTKDSTLEKTYRTASNLRYNKYGNILFQDLEKGELRSFKPLNLESITLA